MPKKALPLLFVLFASAAAGPRPAASPAGAPLYRVPVTKAEYVAYAKAAAEATWATYDEVVARWRKTFDPKNVFGYRAPGGLLEMAAIYAQLYEAERNPEYVRRAKKVLLTYGDYRSEFPESARKARFDYEDGVPALPDFFTVMRYIRAYEILHRLGQLAPAEAAAAETVISESVAYMLRTQEWGAMNRGMLRAENLAWAVRALPRAKSAGVWEMQRRALGDDNWGHWEIEDATIYNGVWLYSLLGYAEAMGKVADLFKTPTMYTYAQYYLNLICPAGVVPDFGDAHWEANWPHFLVFFEAAARAYGDPALKWAAAGIARKYVDFRTPTNIGLGYMFLDCARWGTDGVAPAAPQTGSREVMEDVQGKKIVFRNGWAGDSTYLLLGYRDEGDGGLNYRDYLRDTIPVEEEKMTHGHADENAIALLMSGGSVLLHDGGYRDYMPSGPYGAYRQDYFHNRLCVRPEKIWLGQKADEWRYSVREAVPGQGVLDFLRDAGSYRRVRTQKIDFLALDDVDYSRTRLIDDGWGYSWDRTIAYVKEADLFVVIDAFKALREDYFTLANLWHTRAIVAKGEHWYDTVYDSIAGATGAPGPPLPRDRHLLIVFPATAFRVEGFEPIKRHYQDEVAIHQTTGQHFELRETTAFATVLAPHAAAEDPAKLAAQIKLLPADPLRAGLGVRIDRGGKTYLVAVKNDLRQDMSRDNRRPRYTYEAGRIAFGDLESNGDFLYASSDGARLSYTIVNLTKALFKGRTLVETRPWQSGLAFDGLPDTAERGKLRYWRDTVDLK